jgi:hypothetical protein
MLDLALPAKPLWLCFEELPNPLLIELLNAEFGLFKPTAQKGEEPKLLHAGLPGIALLRQPAGEALEM